MVIVQNCKPHSVYLHWYSVVWGTDYLVKEFRINTVLCADIVRPEEKSSFFYFVYILIFHRLQYIYYLRKKKTECVGCDKHIYMNLFDNISSHEFKNKHETHNLIYLIVALYNHINLAEWIFDKILFLFLIWTAKYGYGKFTISFKNIF